MRLPPTNAYTISIPNSKPARAITIDKVIRVAVPRSTAAIMSRNILYQDQGYSLNPYAFSKWSDTPNRMLSNLFLTSIGDSMIFRAVLPADSRGKTDYVLESSLQQFHQQIHTDGSSSVKVRIGFYFIEVKSGQVKAAREFIVTEKATTSDAKGGVEALNQAALKLDLQLLEWLAGISRKLTNEG